MADDDDNKSTGHEAPPEQAAAAVPPHGDSKPDWRLPIFTAGISALAALIGAGVGGISSYQAAQSQGDTQLKVAEASVSVAKASVSAQADAALMAKRQTDYANYLTTEIDIQGVEMGLKDYFSGKYIDDFFNKMIDQYNDLKPKTVNADFIVVLGDSPDVDEARSAVAAQQNDIDTDIKIFVKNAQSQQPLDSKVRQDYTSRVDGLQALFVKFTNAARIADMKLPPLKQ